MFPSGLRVHILDLTFGIPHSQSPVTTLWMVCRSFTPGSMWGPSVACMPSHCWPRRHTCAGVSSSPFSSLPPPPTGPVHFRLGLFFFHFLWVGESEPTRVLLFRARSHMSQDHRSQSRRGRPWSTCRLKPLPYGLGKWARGSCLRSHCPLGVLGPLGPKAQNEGVTQTWQHNAFPLKQGFCYRNLMQPGPQIHVEYLLCGVSS